MKKLLLLCQLCLILGLSGSVSALTLSDVNGTWTGTTGGSNVHYVTAASTYGNTIENQVRWGNPATILGQSGLGFTGSAPPDVSFDIDEAFEIGQLSHYNNTIYGGSAASQAFLTITMSFSEPDGLVGDFDFTFAIDETPNWPGPPASDDIISVPASYALETFDIGGIDYTLQILGFGSSSDSIIDSFSSPEGGTNSTKLWGKITTPAPVPEPASVILFGLGILGLIGFSRKTKKGQ